MSPLTAGIITKRLLEPLPTQVVSSELTEREREVLALVARGYTNKQIAEAVKSRKVVPICFRQSLIMLYPQVALGTGYHTPVASLTTRGKQDRLGLGGMNDERTQAKLSDRTDHG